MLVFHPVWYLAGLLLWNWLTAAVTGPCPFRVIYTQQLFSFFFTVYCLFAHRLATTSCFSYVLLPVLFDSGQASQFVSSYLWPNSLNVQTAELVTFWWRICYLSFCTQVSRCRQFKALIPSTVHIKQMHFCYSPCLNWGNCFISGNICLVIRQFYKL